MSTLIRPEISKKKDTWISKHRYYELKHFCLQYPEWKRKILEKTYLQSSSIIKTEGTTQTEFIDKTFEKAAATDEYQRNMDIRRDTCIKADEELWTYLLEAVTEGVTYDYLKMIRGIPCGRSKFYKAYRLFFWHLDKVKA